jgi:hypothetical protein
MQTDVWAKQVLAGKSLASHEVFHWLKLNGSEGCDAVAEDREDRYALRAGVGTGRLQETMTFCLIGHRVDMLLSSVP